MLFEGQNGGVNETIFRVACVEKRTKEPCQQQRGVTANDVYQSKEVVQKNVQSAPFAPTKMIFSQNPKTLLREGVVYWGAVLTPSWPYIGGTKYSL